MKIFIYSDLHISKTSSILPLSVENSELTYRQNMIINTGKFLADVIRLEKPDLIINLGDTFDQHTISSYDIKVASLFFKAFEEFKNIPHLVLVGNHEMINSNFNAVALLNNIPNIKVIDEPCTLYNNLAFLPYCDYRYILSYPEGDFLFSHQDIQGSVVRGNFELPEGISKSTLKENYKYVFNGHIHKSSISGNVVNVGSITTHSFSDDSETIPSCYIFDTENCALKEFKSHICPLFRKIEINDINDLNNKINELDDSYKYVIQCTTPFKIKDEVKEYLSNNDKIVSFRLNVKLDKSVNTNQIVNENINESIATIDMDESFKQFIKSVDLKYPEDKYIDILNEIKSVKEDNQ